jgi:hypothetical protein
MKISFSRVELLLANMIHVFKRLTQQMRAVAKTAVFFLKVFPMLPSRPVDWVTKTPVIEKVSYPSLSIPYWPD